MNRRNDTVMWKGICVSVIWISTGIAMCCGVSDVISLMAVLGTLVVLKFLDREEEE